jgi:superfamily II DNA/RNA helicase
MNFDDLGLSEKTLMALGRLNYIEPTEVQQKVIPEVISGNNLIVRSKTGTGKTAAFGIGIIESITAGKHRKALILCPTRELAVQVCKELRGIGQMHSLKIHVVYGGQSINAQMDDIRQGIDILIATPGRLLDLSRRHAVRISEFDIAVLDEADQMLDMGFLDEVGEILDQLPGQRMTLLLSATLDESILSIASKYVPHPLTIEIGEMEAAETIKQEHIETTDHDKFHKLIDVLRTHQDVKTLIFRETKMGTSRLQERLWQRGLKAGALQGDMSQAQRNRVLSDFKDGQIKILVATNVAARGLHIEDLGLIVNYDKAQSEEVHLHRIGRTGRMGKEGKAINFIRRKETLNERMSEEHPDFAWMKGGGLDMYRSSEGPRRGRDRRPGGRSGDRHGGPHAGPRGRAGGHGGHNPYRSEHREGRSHEGSRPGGRGHSGDRRRPHRSHSQ